MEDKIKITWEIYKKDIQDLVEKLKDEMLKGKRFNKVVAIVRGGMIPADYIARKLGIKYIETLCVGSYDTKNNKTELKVIPHSKPVDNRRDWLIVDDLVDTGETIEIAKKLYPNSKVAVLYKKPHSPKPDFYAREMEDIWIDFPWE